MSKLYPIILLLGFDLTQAAPDHSACTRLLTDIDREIRSAGVADTQAVRLSGFPILRSDRFLASFHNQPMSQPEKLEWLQHSARLGSLGLQVELLNLSRKISSDEMKSITQCQRQLLDVYQLQPGLIETALRNSAVPHGYHTLARVVGLYWLTRYFTTFRIKALQDEARTTFGQSQTGELIYGPPSKRSDLPAATPAELLAISRRRSVLKIPTFTDAELDSLFQRHAPYWGIAQIDDSDRPGSLLWHDNALHIDTSTPAVYQYLSYARFHGDILPQLNYVIWFKRRPKQHLLDLYGGKLDGVIWRATLGSDGQVLLYDSIHSCGCYHKFYVIDKTLQPNSPDRSEEPPLVFSANLPDSHTPVVIHLTAATHYVVGLTNYHGETVEQLYSRMDYSQLSNLPYRNGHRSGFSTNGLIKGSERLERFLLWPMGVPSAGAMRQRGHHLTAFVGKRHFDDPDLFTRMFTRQVVTHQLFNHQRFNHQDQASPTP